MVGMSVSMNRLKIKSRQKVLFVWINLYRLVQMPISTKQLLVPWRYPITSFKYLGSVITDKGSKPEILSRIAQTTAALTRLKPVWIDKSISLSSKIWLMRSLSHPSSCMLVNHGPSQRNSKEEDKPWKWGATARYHASHTKIMLPTRKSVPRSSRQSDHTKTSWPP